MIAPIYAICRKAGESMRQKMWPTISVRVPPEVFTRIYGQAVERDVPASVVIREALGQVFGEQAPSGPQAA
jgi:hypothetical protein